MINFFLFWVDFPELLSCLCFTRRGLPFVFAPKNPHNRLPEILRWYACGADGRSGGRCTVTCLPNFLGWVVEHILLPSRFVRESSAINDVNAWNTCIWTADWNEFSMNPRSYDSDLSRPEKSLNLQYIHHRYLRTYDRSTLRNSSQLTW